MKRLQRGIAVAHGYLGKTGLTGILLLIAATGSWLTALLPLQHRIAALSVQQTDATVVASQPPATQNAVVGNPLPEFYQHFPTMRSYAPRLNHLYRAAQSEGLVLAEGAYHAVTDSQGKLTYYEINLPMKGSYVQVRRFLRRVFAEFPTVALDRLTLQRASISDGLVESQVRLVWYLEGAP